MSDSTGRRYIHRESENSALTKSSKPNGDRLRSASPDLNLTMSQVALDSPHALTPANLLSLQRTVGNQAVTRLIQPKLMVGPANDQYEQEADQVAERVVQMPDKHTAQRQDEEELQMKPLAGQVQRQDEEEELQMKPLAEQVQRQDEEEELQMKPLAGQVQRQDEEEELQMKANHGPEGGPVAQSVADQIEAARGGGSRLDESVQAKMESAMGADFSRVRVHTDQRADTLNRSLNARAFTTGNDIFFRQGEYRPDSVSGQKLLAHELTHVVQQGAATVRRTSGPQTKYIQRLSVHSDNLDDWNNLAAVKVSEGGLTGVFFITGQDGSQIVVKGMAEAPHRAMFAQTLFEKASLKTTPTRAISAKSKLGRHIIREVEALATRMSRQDPQGAQRVRNKIATLKSAQGLLLMEKARVMSLGELNTSARPTGLGLGQGRLQVTFWQRLLSNDKLWQTFGKMYYIDQFLGNEDRFEGNKLQNIFVDPKTLEAIALDNDTMVPEYIRKLTLKDLSGVYGNVNQEFSANDYIKSVIEGGMIYQSESLQPRAIANLTLIAGSTKELEQKIGQKIDSFLNFLVGGFARQRDAYEQSSYQAVMNAINNVGNVKTNMQRNMLMGAIQGRKFVDELFRIELNGHSRLKNIFDRQVREYKKKGLTLKDEMLFNYLALEIRYRYLELRYYGKKGHNEALATVQREYAPKVTAMGGKTVEGEIYDEEGGYKERIKKIK